MTEATKEPTRSAVEEVENAEPHELRVVALDLARRLDEALRERDLAIAHDRQPYPTAEAYELVCKARTKYQDRAEAAERKLEEAQSEHNVTIGMLEASRSIATRESWRADLAEQRVSRAIEVSLEEAAKIVDKNKVGDELLYGSVTEMWIARAIRALDREEIRRKVGE